MARLWLIALLAGLLAVAQAATRTQVLRQRALQLRNSQGAAKYTMDELAGMTREQLVALIMEKQGTPPADQTYWWHFPDADCAYDDVTGSCQGQTVSGCEATCIKTPGCGGFNYPHGVLKKTDCLSHKAYDGTVDLYVMQNSPQPPPPPPATNFPPIWPYPASFSNGTTTVTVDATTFTVNAPVSTDLANAISRYQALFFQHKISSSPAGLNSLVITVSDLTADLQLGVDESYQLDVPTSGPITLSAGTVFGAYHGLETLSQLITFDFDTKSYYIDSAPWSITDKPRFPHREVLVDSSRHFEPVWTLQALIDSLTYAKINTVHWHLVDSQSFPFDSPSAPLLSKGAYSAQERFTTEDVAQVIEYGRQRGVRIMVEIDTPGHAGSWCVGYPDICPSPTCTQPLNPATNATFEVLANLFLDLTGGARGQGLFPDNVMHLGGDEVDTSCWTNTPSIAQWLKENNLTADGGYEYFVKRAQAIAHQYGRDVVGWEEIWDHFGTSLDKSTIIHQWLPGSTIAQQATAAGYRVLWSTDGVWYLDGLGTTWETMYVQEPCTGIADNLCDTLMLGGGGEMWGETVDTSDIQQTIWPRLGAIAERLWSPREINSTAAASARYSAFRCLLNRRAVAAAPSLNPSARTAPTGPGSCYAQ